MKADSIQRCPSNIMRNAGSGLIEMDKLNGILWYGFNKTHITHFKESIHFIQHDTNQTH